MNETARDLGGRPVHRSVPRGAAAPRVVIYNFVQPGEDARTKQGGVAVYQANLIEALTRRGHEVICLSSGGRYAALRSDPHVVFEPRRVDGGGCERATVVNSPVFAPSHFNFYEISAYTQDPGLDAVPAALRARYGRIDAFHFQNVEGLTAGFLRALRDTFPQTPILISAHNHNLVYPQVNLWWREHRVCVDYLGGRRCVNCLMAPDRHRFERNIRRMNQLLDALGISRHGRLTRAAKYVLRAPVRAKRWLLLQAHRAAAAARNAVPRPEAQPLSLMEEAKAAEYRAYREANLALVEDGVFDAVLAVSERTRQVLIRRGMAPDRIQVSYIGTAQAELARSARRLLALGEEGLHVGYLGYTRADKGFWFLLECLEYPPDKRRATSVTVAAPITEWGAVERLRAMAHRFRAITVHDGYTHRTLDRVLAGVNLGVVPVLWEDNLPQVAIEMVARGVPILTSDRGGAQEIARNPAFVKAGRHASFVAKLEEIGSGRLPLAGFWDNEPRLVTMDEHVDDLLRRYAAAAEARRRRGAAAAAAPALDASARDRCSAARPVLRPGRRDAGRRAQAW